MKIQRQQLLAYINRANVQHEIKVKAIYEYLIQPEVRYTYVNPIVEFIIKNPRFNASQLQIAFKTMLKRHLHDSEFSTNAILLNKTAAFLWQQLGVAPTAIELARNKKFLPEIKVDLPKTESVKVEVFKVEEDINEIDDETIRKNHERARKMREAKAKKKAEREAAEQKKLDKLNN